MEITYYDHNNGVKLIAQLLFDERIVPIFGSGFTKDCIANGGTVPDGKRSTEIMQEIISQIRSFENMSSWDFNKTADRFFNLVPLEKRKVFFKQYFTNVVIEGHRKDFLSLPWPYMYTINIDDGIERTQLYSPVLPYHDAEIPDTSIGLLYKLHGDALYEVLYQCQQNIVFSTSQYIDSLTRDSNRTIFNAISADYRYKNLLFVGCSLENEPDLRYIYTNSKEETSPNTMRCILRSRRLSEEEELDLNEYGVNSVIVVSDYDLFYREVVSSYRRLTAENSIRKYQFENPKHVRLEADNKEENITYFIGEDIFDKGENKFIKSNLQIERSCVREIEKSIGEKNSVLIRGRRFSGKTFILSILAERYQKGTVLYFPSDISIDEDVLIGLLEYYQHSLFLFDSNSLSEYSYRQLAHSSKILKDNCNKLVVAVNSNDTYLSDYLDADTIFIPSRFNKNELRRLNPFSDKYTLDRRKSRETNLDYLTELFEAKQISLSLLNDLPKKFTLSERVLLVLLCVKDKLFFSDISALGIAFRDVDTLIENLKGIVEKLPVSKGEKNSHSDQKIVHNSKYYLLFIMKRLNRDEILETILYIVSRLIGDRSRRRLYVETVLFDTLNQLFGTSKGARELIFDIYSALEKYLYSDMDYLLQRAKSIYRLCPSSYSDLLNAYRYAIKAHEDGDFHIRDKASLTMSLICCLLSMQCSDPVELEDFETKAIVFADEAVSSENFSLYRVNLREEIFNSQRKPYYKLISEICEKHLDPKNEDVSTAWSAQRVLKRIAELNLATSKKE